MQSCCVPGKDKKREKRIKSKTLYDICKHNLISQSQLINDWTVDMTLESTNRERFIGDQLRSMQNFFLTCIAHNPNIVREHINKLISIYNETYQMVDSLYPGIDFSNLVYFVIEDN